MAIPERVLKAMESQGKAKREPSDVEKLMKMFQEHSGKMSESTVCGICDQRGDEGNPGTTDQCRGAED
jgi:hypothetical protein